MYLTCLRYFLTILILAVVLKTGTASDSIVWMVNNLDTIGGLPVIVVGSPKVIDTENGQAVEFNGINDGLFINTNPISGNTSFTIEIIFMPYTAGTVNAEQRFLHIQKDGDDSRRILIELRSNTIKDQWYLDTFIKSPTSNLTLINPDSLHNNNQWHCAALTYGNNVMQHYIDGNLELSGSVIYDPIVGGKTSLGMRQNKVAWYKGAIKMVRYSNRVLSPEELLKGDGTTTSISEINSPMTDAFELNRIYFRNYDSIGILNISLYKASMLSVDIFSMNGQKINVIENQKTLSGERQIPINFSGCTHGMYMVVVTVDGHTQAQKVQFGK